MFEISGVFIILLVLFTFYRVGLYFKLETIRENQGAFIFLASFNALLIIVNWPGLVSVDELYLLKELLLLGVSDWHSFTYSMISGGLMWLGGQPFLLSAFNFLLFLHLLVLIFSLTQWRWRSPLYWIFLFMMTLPQATQLVFFQNRDSTYNLLLLIFSLGLLAAKFTRLPKLKPMAWALLLLAVILGELRQEGKFIALLAPFLIAYFYQFQPRRLAIFIGSCLVLSVLLQWGPSKLYDSFRPYSEVYKVTALLNPVTYIINKVGVDAIPANLRSDIDSVVRLDAITKFANPYDIDVFHNGGLRHPVEPENFARFRTASLKLIFDHFDLYLENRWLIFQRLFLFERNQDLFYDSLRNLPDFSFLEILEKLKASGKSPFYTVPQQIFYEWMYFFSGKLPAPLHIIIASCLASLVGLCFLLLHFRRSPSFAVVAGLILLRSGIVWALAPAGYFKYISSTWVAGVLLVLIYFNIRKSQKSTA